MKVLIVGRLEGHITEASKIAIARGAKVAHVNSISEAMNALRSGQGAEVAAGAADDVVKRAHGRIGHAQRLELLPQGFDFVDRNVGEHQVLLVGGPDFPEAELIRQVGDVLKLGVTDITGRDAGFFQGQGDNGVARTFMGIDVVGHPLVEFPVLETLLGQQLGGIRQGFVSRLREVAADGML